MTTFDVAYFQEQGVQLVVVLVSPDFAAQGQFAMQAATNHLQVCAVNAGLQGVVVPVWQDGLGRMGFFAPPNFAPFFQSIAFDNVLANVNGQLSCQ